MESVVLVIHLILALSIISLVLLQRSEGGGLGIGGGGGGLGGLASAKGTANALTKMTALCAAGFFITSLTLGVLASQQAKQDVGLLENVDATQIEAEAPVNNNAEAQTGITYIPPSEIEDVNAPTAVVEANIEPPVANTETKPTEEPSAPVE